MKKHPIIHAYKYKEDLLELKDWFYNFDTVDNRFRAVQKVKALLSRGKLPHTIEITSLLTSTVLIDEKNEVDTNILKLSYSMTIIRFVNGLLDNFQQANYAIPLYQLAKSLNLPSFFVELRHMSTHESLPELSICRIACKRALNWLYDNYWQDLDDEDDDDDEDDEFDDDDEDKGHRELQLNNDEKIQVDEFATKSLSICNDLKVYKKIRKSNLNLIYKFGDSSTTGKLYWKSLKNLKNYKNSSSELFINCLLFNNFIIYNDEQKFTKKFNEKLVTIYKPLLDEFGPQFKIELFQHICQQIGKYFTKGYDKISRKLLWFANHQFEIIQFINWLKFLSIDILNDSSSRNQLLTELLEQLRSTVDLIPENQYEVFDEVIKLLQNLLESFNSKTLKNKINLTNKNTIESWLSSLKSSTLIKKSFNVPSLEELLAEPSNSPKLVNSQNNEPPKKRQKLVKSYLFEDIPNWKPTPFGQCM